MGHRRECWRCRRTLPTSFAIDAGMDGVMRSDTEMSPPDRVDVLEALDHALVINLCDDDATGEGFSRGRRLLWLFGKRSHLA